jgi:hypothetical protein
MRVCHRTSSGDCTWSQVWHECVVILFFLHAARDKSEGLHCAREALCCVQLVSSQRPSIHIALTHSIVEMIPEWEMPWILALLHFFLWEIFFHAISYQQRLSSEVCFSAGVTYIPGTQFGNTKGAVCWAAYFWRSAGETNLKFQLTGQKTLQAIELWTGTTPTASAWGCRIW